MLGRWRVALKQAEEAARFGRYSEALKLTAQSDVADHRQAIALRGRLVQELIAQAKRRCEADDVAGALQDLSIAETFQAPPDALAASRLKIAERVEPEIRELVSAGQPLVALERVESLASQKVSGPSLRKIRDICESWKHSIEESRKGEFGRAVEFLEQAERLAGETASAAFSASRRDLAHRRDSLEPRVDRLYSALNAGRWTEVLVAAEAALELAPDHEAARQLRQRAWQQIAAINPTADIRSSHRPAPAFAAARIDAHSPSRPTPPVLQKTAKPEICWLDDEPAPSKPPIGVGRWMKVGSPSPAVAAPRHGHDHNPFPPPHPLARPASPPRAEASAFPDKLQLWVDVVGGYLICLDKAIVLGRASSDSLADVPILGDLSRQHATIIRDGDSYVVRAIQPIFVNGRRADSSPLRDGDIIRLGSAVELRFRQPSPISATARLELVSKHRFPTAVNGVILMADSCILGRSPQSHVSAPHLSEQVVIYRQGDALWCRASGAFEVDGRSCVGRAPLNARSNVLGEAFSFSLEPSSFGPPSHRRLT